MSEEFEEESSGCTFEHSRNEVCPECCGFGGVFSSGTEECEFCIWGDVCRETLAEVEGDMVDEE